VQPDGLEHHTGSRDAELASDPVNRRGFIGSAVAAILGRRALAGTGIGPGPGLSIGGAAGGISVGGNFAAGGASALSYENLRQYKNTVREGRGFTTPGTPWSAQVTLGATGWPTAAHSVVIWEGGFIPGWLSAATSGTPMKCGFIGTGTPSNATFGSGTVANIVMGNGTTTYTTFDLYGASGGAFGFQNSAGCTNEFAYMAAYPGSVIDDRTLKSSETPEWLSVWGNCAWLRNMWLNYVTGNTGANSSATRRTFANTQANQNWSSTATEGYPQEQAIYGAAHAGIGLWANLPAYDDGTNFSAGSYTNAVLTLINTVIVPTGKPVYIELLNEVWNSYASGVGGTLGTNAVAKGFATSTSDYQGIYQYFGYLYHELANMCRTIFGANFGIGKQVQLVACNQLGTGWSTAFPYMLNYMSTNYGAPSADIQNLGWAPYMNLSNNSGDGSTAAVIADLTAQAPVTVYNFQCEHGSIFAKFWQMNMLMYEGQWQVNTEAANSFIPTALASSSLTAPLVTWGKSCIDAGFKSLTWFEVGCSQANSGNTPEDELSNTWSTLVSTGSPQLAAIQALSSPYTPQRNIVAASGSTTISLFADQLTPTPISMQVDANGFLFAFGSAPMQVQFPTAATKTLTINATGSSGTVSVIIDNVTVASGITISSGANVIGSFAFSATQHGVSVGTSGFQNPTIVSATFS
jgi:hypothetical protein